MSNNVPPPELPVYDQPPIPAPGYIWTPGYWAGGPSGYFWVPGTWVQPPEEGMLWTPGYWGWRDGIYIWNAGYWGPHVGFYGGINYGYGYGGDGYEGGHWDHGVFAYNRTVNNFGSVRITNVYEKTVVVNPTTVRVSFNGGSGGTVGKPTAQEAAAAHDKHIAADQAQLQHERTASADKSLLASENHGHPAIAATAKPGAFSGPGVVAAHEATPAAPAVAKPTGLDAVHPNPETTRLQEVKPGENGALQKEHELPRGQELPRSQELPKGQAAINGAPPPQTRPLTTETRPLNTGTKPVEHEPKPIENGRPENREVKLPPAEPKPQVAPPPKPPAPQPHAEVAPPPHPAAQAVRPPAPPQRGNPEPRDKRPPG